jgi:HD superfamily phosphodiesterase
VADLAIQIAESADQPVNVPLLSAAALLHDLDRARSDASQNHAESAADFLYREGYTEIAELVRCHHDLAENSSPEAEILFLADKLVRGTQRVSLDERFAQSYEKCDTAEAQAAWRRRYDRAQQLQARYLK